MAIYGGMQPSEYHLRRDARKDDKFRDIINLFLQLKQSKEQTRQFDVGTRLEEEKMAYMEPYYKERAGYYGKPEKPVIGATQRNTEWAADTLGITPKEYLLSKETSGKIVPRMVPAKFGKFLTETFGEDWHGKITYDQYKDWRDEFQRSRPDTSGLKKEFRTALRDTNRYYTRAEAQLRSAFQADKADPVNRYMEQFLVKMGIAPVETLDGAVGALKDAKRNEVNELRVLYGLDIPDEDEYAEMPDGTRVPINEDGSITIDGKVIDLVKD